MKLNAFLEIKIIYVDDILIELKIKGSNEFFQGETMVYTNTDLLSKFANDLKDYPKNKKCIFFELGKENSNSSYFSVNFYPADSLSHIGTKIVLESETGYRIEDKNKIQFEIIVEPNAIDNFRKAIYHIAKYETGSAILVGITK